jgi:hypothetical protein
MDSIELEYQRGLEWSGPASRVSGMVRAVWHSDLEIVGVWPLLKRIGMDKAGYFMMAGGN